MYKTALKIIAILFCLSLGFAMRPDVFKAKRISAQGPPNPEYESLLSDSLYLYSPEVLDFDIQEFLDTYPGPLKNYEEVVDNQAQTAAEIIRYNAMFFGVNPQFILIMLEAQDSLITDAYAQVPKKLDENTLINQSFFQYVKWITNVSLTAFDGRRYQQSDDHIEFSDGNSMQVPTDLNPGTYAVQASLAQIQSPDRWRLWVTGPTPAFVEVFSHWFRNPLDDPDKSISASALPSGYILPFSLNERWYYTGGPHHYYGPGYDRPRSSIDIAPPEIIGCPYGGYPAQRWVVAAKGGNVIQSSQALVIIDHGDGYRTYYLHMTSADQRGNGNINQGDHIGHPSCECLSKDDDDCTSGVHLHFAIWKKGTGFVDISGLELSGWQIQETTYYNGRMVRNGVTRTALTSRSNGTNDIYNYGNDGGGGGGGGGGSSTTCPAPTLREPANGGNLNSRTVNFKWDAISGCTFSGYEFRVCASRDIENASNCFIEESESSTQLTKLITGWDNRDLYWGVKAANAPGAKWAPASRFRIMPETGSSCPQSGGVILYRHADFDCGGLGANSGYVQKTNPGDYDIGGEGLNEQASSIRIPEGGGLSVALYEGAGQSGAVACLTATDNNFDNNTYDNGQGLNDSVTSFKIYNTPNCNGVANEAVKLCRDVNYGNCINFVSDASSLGSTGVGNDSTKSIDLASGWQAMLFEHDGYKGNPAYFNGDNSDLENSPVGYGASSLRVKKDVPALFTLYQRGDYGGAHFASDRTIANLDGWHFDNLSNRVNDRVQSIKIDSSHEVILCTDADFHGVCGRTKQDTGDLNAVAQGLRDGASSVRVCAGSCPPGPSSSILNRPLDNEALAVGSPVIFEWSGDGDRYEVEVWGGALPSPRKSGWRAGNQWIITDLPVSSNPYYWKVKSWNGYGETHSSTQRFNIISAPPPEIYLDLMTSLNKQVDLEIAVTKVGKFHDQQDFVLPPQLFTSDSSGNHPGLHLAGVAPGPYDIYVKPTSSLRKVVSVQLVAGTNPISFSNFVRGDTNGDNEININDLVTVIIQWGTSDPYADANEDGVVDLGDFVHLIQNWGKGDGWQDSGPFEITTNNFFTQSIELQNSKTGSLTLVPDKNVLNVGDTLNMGILLDTDVYTSTGFETTIFYDPGVLEVQDTYPLSAGIQISLGSLYDGNKIGTVDQALGKIDIRAESASGSYFQGSGTVASVSFTATASISNTAIEMDYRDGWTSDSNIVDGATAQDILGNVNSVSVQIVGSPSRPLPTAFFVRPSENAAINSSDILLEVEASDPFTQIREVKFEANMNGQWVAIGQDTYGANGWDYDWDASSFPDNNLQLRAIASLPGGEGTTVYRNITLDRTLPVYVSSSFTPTTIIRAGEPMTIAITAADSESGVDHVDVYARSTNVSENNYWSLLGTNSGDQGKLVWNVPDDLAGTYQIVFSIQDKAGNWGPDPQPQLLVDIAANQGNGVFLPVILNKATPCEENLSNVKIWEGELNWDCDTAEKQEGQSSVRLEAAVFSDSELYSPLMPVLPNQSYEVSYWVKTNLEVDDAQVYGKVVAAQYTSQAQESDAVNENRIDTGFSLGESVGGVTDWVKKSYTFTTDATAAYVRLRAPMGLQGRARGQVWFDEVRIIEK